MDEGTDAHFHIECMIDHLNWRYATKKFDPAKKIPKRELEGILEALRLAPSSYGLQPWKFILIEDEALRRDLKPHAKNQSQITDASNLIVLCALKTMDENYVKNYVTRIAKVRGVERGTLAAYEQTMLGSLRAKTPEALSLWMKKQVYIALGMLLAECAHRKIDACPMEGFSPKEFDEVLGLAKEGLESVVLCTIGYRAQDDKYAALAKVRFGKNEVFIQR